HLKFFNTNEYLSGFALGIVMNLELKKDDEFLDKAKTILSSNLGAIGDKLINQLILPILILVALNKFVSSDFRLDNCAVIVILCELFVFNIFNFSIRYYGIKSGFEKGIDSIKIFKSSSYKKILLYMTLLRNFLIIILITNLFIYSNILLFFSN
ncbi:MAG: PTS system mannose/fructose/sorbose family transporter subunit IID, partial [Candidatus Delongbacteria bacterium]|nr:PTS system mannose/fructose/sorbose family transporter subunit IID [Candidatus Delongbacteria bacterium]